MTRTELKEFFAKAEKVGKAVKLTYYCKAGKGTFFVRTLDADGKPVNKKHAITGAILTHRGKPIYEEQPEDWTPIVTTRSTKADALSFRTVESDANGVFTPYQQEMIAVLEGLAGSQMTVQRESDYKKDKNPEAWNREQELERLKGEHGQKVETAYNRGKAEKQSEIDALRARLAEVEGRIDQVPEVKTEPHKKGNKKA